MQPNPTKSLRSSYQEFSDGATVPEQFISLDEIQALEYATSETKDEDHESLYESTKHRGVQQPFVVARHPDSDKYVLVAGGNTRLRILQRLNKESGGELHATVPCALVPWPGVCTAKVNHLITDDVLHSSSFYARAKAIIEFIDGNDDLSIDRTTSDRGVSKFFDEHGLPLYRTTYRTMRYAIDSLEPIFPLALTSSFTAKDVARIQSLERQHKNRWLEAGKPEAEFDRLFRTAAKKFDHEDLSYETFYREFSERIRSEFRTGQSHSKESEIQDASETASSDTKSSLGASRVAVPTTTPTDEITTNGELQAETDVADAFLDFKTSNTSTLTATIRKLALELASRFNLANCISKSHRGGTGFLVVELPPQTEDPGHTRKLIWEYLANFSGICEMSTAELLPFLDSESRLYYDIQNQGRERASAPEVAKNLDLSVLWHLDPKSFRVLLQLWKAVYEHHHRCVPAKERESLIRSEPTARLAA